MALAPALAGGAVAAAAVRRGDVRRRLRGPGIARAGANSDRPSPAGANPGAHADAAAIPHSPSDGNRNAAAYANTYANAVANGDSRAAPNADFHARTDADADRYAAAARPPGAYRRCRLCC